MREATLQAYEGLQPLGVSKLFAALAKKEGANMIIVGKQAIDDDSNQTAQITAGLLDWFVSCHVHHLYYRASMTVTAIFVGIQEVAMNIRC